MGGGSLLSSSLDLTAGVAGESVVSGGLDEEGPPALETLSHSSLDSSMRSSPALALLFFKALSTSILSLSALASACCLTLLAFISSFCLPLVILFHSVLGMSWGLVVSIIFCPNSSAGKTLPIASINTLSPCAGCLVLSLSSGEAGAGTSSWAGSSAPGTEPDVSFSADSASAGENSPTSGTPNISYCQ